MEILVEGDSKFGSPGAVVPVLYKDLERIAELACHALGLEPAVPKPTGGTDT